MYFTINSYRKGDRVTIDHYGPLFDLAKARWFSCHYPTGWIESCNQVTATVRLDSGEVVAVARILLKD